MLTRLLRRLLGQPEPRRAVDPVALDVTRRQRAVARKLATMVDRTPEELLDYQRADEILRRGRGR